MLKPGWKTTEFYVTATTIVGLVLGSLSSVNVLPTKYAALAAGLSAAGYAIARGLAKINPPKP